MPEYKSVYSQFNLQDIFQKCGAFLRKWQSEYAHIENSRKAEAQRATPTSPKMALYSYLYEEYVMKGGRIQDSALYQYGFVTDDEVAGIESGRLLCL